MKVTYIDHMGTDLSVVNAARVSFSKKSEGMVIMDHVLGTKELNSRDKNLISFLARGCTSGDWQQLLYDMGGSADQEFEDYANYIKRMPDHWTPFGHTAITLHIKAPIFVARQLGKHQVGFVWNEVSRRYVDDDPEFYIPYVWRKRADNVKQGSSDEPINILRMQGFGEQTVHDAYFKHQMHSLDLYRDMIDRGIAPEQARMILPQSMYTEWYWTGNLYGFANVYNQRSDSHAQRETQEIAKQIGNIIAPLFPVSWKELTK